MDPFGRYSCGSFASFINSKTAECDAANFFVMI